MDLYRIIKTFTIPVLILILSGACKAEPEPIAYESDACHFCRMTIVDRQHGAEMVSNKGKVFKFDAVECLLNSLKDADPDTFALFLVNTYGQPGELQEASQAVFLVSEGIPSPMGEYLTAFTGQAAAEAAREEHGGTIYSWEEIRNLFNQ